MGRLRLATVWLGGCSGCHMSFLDLDEFLIELAEQVDIVFTPVHRRQGVPRGGRRRAGRGGGRQRGAPGDDPPGPRRNTEVLISFGDCAVTGNVTAMRNPLGAAEPVLRRSLPRERRPPRADPARAGHRPRAAGPGDAGPRRRPGRLLPARLPAAGPSHPRRAGAADRRDAGSPDGPRDQVRLRTPPTSEGRDSHGTADRDRPGDPDRGPRQDHRPTRRRRPGRRRAVPRGGVPRLREVLRGPAALGDAEPHGPGLRHLPGQPPDGLGQGRRPDPGRRRSRRRPRSCGG